jgi:hypothetical protein
MTASGGHLRAGVSLYVNRLPPVSPAPATCDGWQARQIG